MLAKPTSRRRTAFLAAWIAVALPLWLTASATENPAPTWRAIPRNLAELATAPARFITRRLMPREHAILVSSIACAFAYTAAGAFVVSTLKRKRTRSAHDPSRRAFITKLGAAGTALTATGAVAKAAVIDPLDLRVARHTVPIRNLPQALDGMRIAHLSDWHVGPRVPLELLEASTRAALDLNPDLIALTGDFVHSKVAQLDTLRDILAPLLEPGASRFGTVSVLGNHDYYDDHEAVRETLEELGVLMLDNDRMFIMPDGVVGDQSDALCIAGLADPWMDTPVQELALGGVPERTARVILCHQPDVAEHFGWRISGAPRADLMLSGHTHGGQVRLPLLGTPIVPSRFGQKYAGGLTQGPHFPVITSRGIGMSILPIRWGVPPEIGEITLTRA